MQSRVRSGAAGPSEEAAARGVSLLWGEAVTADGRRAVSRLRASSGYVLTAQTAVHLAMKVLTGEVRAGFQTPSRMYGPDVILEIPGVTRTDEA